MRFRSAEVVPLALDFRNWRLTMCDGYTINRITILSPPPADRDPTSPRTATLDRPAITTHHVSAVLTATAAKPSAVGLRVRLCQAFPHLPVAVLIGAYIVRFSLLSVDVHDGFGTPGYDMGIFDQGVWLLSRFHAPS